jgi:hypothetical protein
MSTPHVLLLSVLLLFVQARECTAAGWGLLLAQAHAEHRRPHVRRRLCIRHLHAVMRKLCTGTQSPIEWLHLLRVHRIQAMEENMKQYVGYVQDSMHVHHALRPTAVASVVVRCAALRARAALLAMRLPACVFFPLLPLPPSPPRPLTRAGCEGLPLLLLLFNGLAVRYACVTSQAGVRHALSHTSGNVVLQAAVAAQDAA